MNFRFLGPDPLEVQVESILSRLAEGAVPGDVETRNVDVKEERGRRDGRAIRPGSRKNEEAARQLVEELACMANSAGGGAIILGVADDGKHVGTEIDGEWLRHRIWELSNRLLTISVREVDFSGTRLLVLRTDEALEPVSVHGRAKHRIRDNCVDIDLASWHAERRWRSGYDWSAEQSGHTITDVQPLALELARRYLTTAGDRSASELAEASNEDLLRRIHVLSGQGSLTNAGSILFVDTPDVTLDYIRRDYAGGDSTMRVRARRSLLEQLYDVEQAARAANRVTHSPEGLAHGQFRAIPERALREALVNGVVHRDWRSLEPTMVEHVADSIVVTSPGGFIGGIDSTNIITHPSVARYRHLAEVVAALRLSEREGIGIDRMVLDMLAHGHPRPEISELAGPRVRVCLIGGPPDAHVVSLLSSVEPPNAARDVNSLLILHHLVQHGWIDAVRAAPVLQRSVVESQAALQRLGNATLDNDTVITMVDGVPSNDVIAYRLGEVAQERLRPRLKYLDTSGRTRMFLDWARNRGRISSTEAAALASVSVPHAGTILSAMEDEGLLRAGRATRRGRGFFYVAAGDS